MGPNHVATGTASYTNVAAMDYIQKKGLLAFDDSELVGSAGVCVCVGGGGGAVQVRVCVCVWGSAGACVCGGGGQSRCVCVCVGGQRRYMSVGGERRDRGPEGGRLGGRRLQAAGWGYPPPPPLQMSC